MKKIREYFIRGVKKSKRKIFSTKLSNLSTTSERKKMLLLLGPESSGTRVFTSILSKHPKVLGTPEALGHLDVLDPVWQSLENLKTKEASQKIPKLDDQDCAYRHKTDRHAAPWQLFGNDQAGAGIGPVISGILLYCRLSCAHNYA